MTTYTADQCHAPHPTERHQRVFAARNAQTYETGDATTALAVSAGKGSVTVSVTSNNSNPYASDLGGASAQGILDYQISVLGKPGASSAPPDGTPITLDVASVIGARALSGPASERQLVHGQRVGDDRRRRRQSPLRARGPGRLRNQPLQHHDNGRRRVRLRCRSLCVCFQPGEWRRRSLRRSGSDDRSFDPRRQRPVRPLQQRDRAGFGLAGSPVPEPSTWALMLLGLAGLGWSGLSRVAKERRRGRLTVRSQA